MEPEGQYQGTINLFINWLLDLTLIPRFNQAIMGFTRPLRILLGHYRSAIMASASHVINLRHEWDRIIIRMIIKCSNNMNINKNIKYC